MKKFDKTMVPRNPLAVLARQRRAGAHGVDAKSQRRRDKTELKRELFGWSGSKEKGRDDFPPFFFAGSTCCLQAYLLRLSRASIHST